MTVLNVILEVIAIVGCILAINWLIGMTYLILGRGDFGREATTYKQWSIFGTYWLIKDILTGNVP